MKFIITESQKDKAIFKYLDNQDLVVIGYGDNLYFVNSEEDEFAKIVYVDSSDLIRIENEERKWAEIEQILLDPRAPDAL